MHLLITIDTEADNLKSSCRGMKLTCENIGALKTFHDLSTSWGFPPTYLVSYEVLQTDQSSKALRALARGGNCEVGSHLHPWVTPPLTRADGTHKRFPSDLPKDLLYEKMATLTTAIEDHLETSPRVYRAGRWGFNLVNAMVLEELGYCADCSITPYVRWAGAAGQGEGPDYRQYEPTPFFIENTQHGRILEVPVTIFPQCEHVLVFRPVRYAFQRSRSDTLNRVLRHLGLRARWLRPYGDNDLARFIALHAVAARKGLDVLQLMFHSFELMPGKFSPYKSATELLDMLQQFFSYLRRRDVVGITLSGYYTMAVKTSLYRRRAIP